MKTYRWLWVSVFVFGSAMALLWMIGVQPRSVRAAVLCVNPGGTGGCYDSIQLAVTAAGDGDTVQVAQGVYFETVMITKSLTLEGGWNDDFTVQDWDVYVTTIDAQHNGSVIRTGLPWDVTAITVVIEGFTLMNGDNSAYLGWGGGILLQDDFIGVSQFTVRHNVISNNIACQNSSCQGQGGGIYVYGGFAVIEDNFIGNNIARWEGGGGRGGGISVGGYGEVTIERNTIIANTAVFSTTGLWDGKGGGVDLEFAGDATLRDNEISKNFAAVNGIGLGGGIYAKGNLYNNVISENTASVNDVGYGGGVYAYHTGTFERNIVEGNIASLNDGGTGGGIYVIYLQNAVGNTIIDNEATRGGGVYYNSYVGEENFSYNTVARNQATGASDATQDGGGGITSAADRVVINGNTIIGNTAYGGGGVQIVDGDLYEIRDNHIELNTGFGGGGILVKNATGVIVDNTIFDNTSLFGGGMYVYEAASPVIEHNRIISNTAQGFYGGGGGVLLNLNDGTTVNLINNIIAQNAAGSGGHGGGVQCWRGNCSLTHNTIVDNNRGTHQEGVFLGSSYGGNFTLRNNIIAGHSTGVYLYDGSATSNYNDYFDNSTNLYGIAMGAHDQLDNPQFVNRLGGDYHLEMTSPLIDQGLGGLGITLDFEGDPRPHGAGVDIGADEAYRSETYVSERVGSDITGDGSPDHPYVTVTRGIYETGTNGTVYVGRGRYLEPVGIHHSLNLLGGYNEEDWSRDIVLNETILDAHNLATVVVIYGEGVQGLIEGFTITGGEASFYGNGGGIMVSDHAVAIIRRNVITGNHAPNGGAGIVLWGNEYIESVVDSNTICGNVSDGVFTPLETIDPLVPNQGSEPGGGLLVGSPARVVNNIVYGNTAAAGGDGLVLIAWENSIKVFHNTIVDNGGSGGEGLLLFRPGSELEIYDNLIVGHGVGISTTEPVLALWDYNAFYGNGLDYTAGLEAGLHDVHGNPFFVDSAAGNYHITVASVAAGTGNDVGVAEDFDGDPRPAPPASAPDIGADEITQRRMFLPLVRK